MIPQSRVLTITPQGHPPNERERERESVLSTHIDDDDDDDNELFEL